MPEHHVHILGYATVPHKNRDQFLTLVDEMVNHNRMEKGCLQSLVLQDNSNPEKFILQETWQDNAAWIQHLQTSNITKFTENSKDLVTGLVLQKCSNYGI